MTWFWLVIFYSFGGYLLEKGYAAAVRSPHRVRKCFLLLPLCPVYGLAMLAAGHLPPSCTEPFWRLVLYGGLTCTAVEYAVHFLYEKLLGVLFWDYSDTKLDLNRRICFPFAVVWGLLSAAVLRWVQPVLWPLAASVPAGAGYAMVLLLIADGFFTARILRRRGDIDLLRPRKLLRELRPESTRPGGSGRGARVIHSRKYFAATSRMADGMQSIKNMPGSPIKS